MLYQLSWEKIYVHLIRIYMLRVWNDGSRRLWWGFQPQIYRFRRQILFMHCRKSIENLCTKKIKKIWVNNHKDSNLRPWNFAIRFTSGAEEEEIWVDLISWGFKPHFTVFTLVQCALSFYENNHQNRGAYYTRFLLFFKYVLICIR